MTRPRRQQSRWDSEEIISKADAVDSVDTLVAYIEGLGTQFSCFDSCLQGEPNDVACCRSI